MLWWLFALYCSKTPAWRIADKKGFWSPWNVDVCQGSEVRHGRRGQISNYNVTSCCQEACCILCCLCTFRIWPRGKCCQCHIETLAGIRQAWKQRSSSQAKREGEGSISVEVWNTNGPMARNSYATCWLNIVNITYLNITQSILTCLDIVWHISTYVDFHMIYIYFFDLIWTVWPVCDWDVGLCQAEAERAARIAAGDVSFTGLQIGM